MPICLASSFVDQIDYFLVIYIEFHTVRCHSVFSLSLSIRVNTMTSVIVPGLWSSCNLCFAGFAVRTCEDPSSSSFLLGHDVGDLRLSRRSPFYECYSSTFHLIWPKCLRHIYFEEF